MKNIDDFVNSIISEAALDARIPDGVVDMKNIQHIQIIAEAIYDMCGDEDIVNEAVSKFVEEGKYPERQAYNKDGWLVTFPSKEYRDAAIKKGTHAISDPTHGKGGMNLYYKKKGKQKRQTQQKATAIQATQAQQVSSRPKTEPTTQTPVTPQVKKQGSETASQSAVTKAAPVLATPAAAKKEPSVLTPPTKTPAATSPDSEKPTEEPSTSAAPSKPSAPAIDVPVVTASPEQYSSVSKKFAAKKGWILEPYGEYRDAEGNPVAVVGLSGEVVPIRSNDREEYRLFAEKSAD